MEPGTRFIFRLISAIILWFFLLYLADGCAVNIYQKLCDCPDTVYITLPRPVPEVSNNTERLWREYKIKSVNDIFNEVERDMDSIYHFDIKKLTSY